MSITRRSLVRGLAPAIVGAAAGGGVLTSCSRDADPGTSGEDAGTLGAAPPTPDTPLVLGSIGASYGRAAAFETPISIAITEAMIDLNARWGGVLGHEVTMQERHVAAAAGEDLSAVIATMADAGVSAVITSLDEESLVAVIPALVDAQIAVIDVLTSGMSVREPEVASATMLIRLAPDDVAIATLYAEQAWTSGSDGSGPPGTIAYVSEDTAQGRSLVGELTRILAPRGGKILTQQFYPAGDAPDLDAVVEAVLAEPPALLVVNGGPEVGPLLSALHDATRDGSQQPAVTIPSRLGPAASVDYSEDALTPECLASATGYLPGDALDDTHVNMMLNVDSTLLATGFGYSQQAYDAVLLAGLAAEDAVSVGGVDIAGSLERVLSGTQECAEFGDCSALLRDARAAGQRTTISFTGRSGPLELGSDNDVRTGKIRSRTWDAENSLDSEPAIGSAPTTVFDTGG
ncbi:ABC transporter substrate-binding protein [Brachybacterium tyrofermentans]|uniref:ABC transporter substrate-binding protein n=1 Tax=Brachybacterium tyrofermentans TaxID=47848 RepID=UPI003FD06234